MSYWNNETLHDEFYNFEYQGAMNPLFAKFVFTTSGLSFPDLTEGTACELGFGQGVSIVMHAAGSQVQWFGTDFNPKHVTFATQLAQAGELKVQLSTNDFAEFTKRDDLPMFDFICLHDVWAWLNQENQNYIVDFVRNHLNIGGILYISYPVAPGMISFEPICHMLDVYNEEQLPQQMENKERILSNADYLQSLINTNPQSLTANPSFPYLMKNILNTKHTNLNHEYLSSYLNIIHFSNIENILDRAKLTFATSATSNEHLDHFNLTAEQQEFLKTLNCSSLYETVRDFIVYQQFRRDFFVKGKIQLSPVQTAERISKLQLILNTSKDKFSYEIKNRLGTTQLPKEIYSPVLEVLGDYKVHSFGEVVSTISGAHPKSEQLTASNINETLCNLVYLGAAAPAVDPTQLTQEVIERCKKLNHEILFSNNFNHINCLVSPVTQGGVVIQDVGRKMLKWFIQNEKCTVEYLVDALIKDLEASSGDMIIDDQTITDKDEQKQILTQNAQSFLNEEMAMYRGLMLL